MRILVVDDDLGVQGAVRSALAADGHEVRAARFGDEALMALDEFSPDIVLCDLRTPETDGLEFVQTRAVRNGRPLVIAMSEGDDRDAPIAAMRRGAYDHIRKPFGDEELVRRVRRAAEHEQLRSRVRRLEWELGSLREVELVGESTGIRAVVEAARKVARHQSTVLITGERGTGKESIARLIHQSGPRAKEPFATVKCDVLPDVLLESELFGHVAGSFVGAVADGTGLFEEADGGTLLLDEVGELPATLQVKLLRVLQEGEVRRMGSNGSRKVDVRVIAATSRDLAADATSGRFREDLYYRVNVVSVRLPPLRERRDDIPSLALHFVRKHGARLGFANASIEPDALVQLADYSWPGNVRELENVVERALVISGGTIRSGKLAELVQRPRRVPDGSSAEGDLSVKRRTEELERRLIRRALERTRGNRTRAARLLDLSHRALLYKIRDYGLGD